MNGDGIELGGDYNVVTANIANNNLSAGIKVTSSGANNTISGNMCYNNQHSGIYVYSGSNLTITGNTCVRGTGAPSDYSSSQYTIRLGSTSTYATVENNLIVGNNIMGKNYVDGGTNSTFANNKYQ